MLNTWPQKHTVRTSKIEERARSKKGLMKCVDSTVTPVSEGERQQNVSEEGKVSHRGKKKNVYHDAALPLNSENHISKSST